MSEEIKGPADDLVAEMRKPYDLAVQRLSAIIRDFKEIAVGGEHYRCYPPQISTKVSLELANLKNAFKAIAPEVCVSCCGAKCRKCDFTGWNPSNKNEP